MILPKNKSDRKAQEAIYKKYYDKMLVVCMRYASDKHEAKDFLQEGFLRVFNKIHKFSRIGSFEGWMRKVISNVCIDKLRKRKKSIISYDNLDCLDQYNELEKIEVEPKYSAEQCLYAIQKLSPKYKLVFNMFVMDGYSHNEISKELGIGIGTSKSNLYKAKKKIKETLINLS